MANIKTTMTDIRVIIREFSRGTSLREMERKLKLSRTSLRNYRNRAESSGISMIDLLKLNNAELQAIMQKGEGHRGRDEPAECVSTSVFKIEEVIDEYYAIAEEVEYESILENYYLKYGGIKVVIKSEEKNKYFDEQIIKNASRKMYATNRSVFQVL